METKPETPKSDLSPEAVEKLYAQQWTAKQQAFMAALNDLARQYGVVLQGKIGLLPAFLVGTEAKASPQE